MRLRCGIYHDLIPADAVVARLHVHEELSAPFDVHVELLCQDPEIDLAAMIWSEALVILEDLDAGSDQRCWHGCIEEAELAHVRREAYVYRLRLRPRMSGLAYRVRTRIFQDKDVKDIVKQVLQDSGIGADSVEWRTQRDYPKRDFCMQYRESELAFVSRLLEDEGIFYWFDHLETDHVLVLADDPSVHEPIDGEAILPFSTQDQADREAVTDLVYRARHHQDIQLTRDWNFEKPGEPLEGTANDGSSGGYSRYEYPGGFADNGIASRMAQDRLDAMLVHRMTLRGRTNCRRLMPGRLLTVADARPDFVSGEYLLLGLDHHFEETGVGRAEAGHVHAYRTIFRAAPSSVTFRPGRATPKPRVAGKESAVVTGPSGEEIHVDQYGRIKVHFYFDRENPVDDTASYWIRVQQQNLQGSMILPRVGWEVDVGFLDGDPDRPMVLQKMYNLETMPPYGLPENQTQSALQSSTSPGGGSTNEVRLQDSNGGMEFFVHASKDFKCVVGNDMSEEITVDSKEEIGLEQACLVGGDETCTVGGTQGLSVTKVCKLETVGDKTVHVGSDDWGITKNYSIKTSASRTENIDGLMNVLANKVAENFNAGHKRHVGAAQVIISATAIVEAVGGAKTEKVGAAKIVITPKACAENIGAAKMLTSGAVVLKTGGDIGVGATGAVMINVAGPIKETITGDFTFNAKTVKIVAPGGVTIKGGGTTTNVKGSTIEVDASGFGGSGGPKLDLKGTINYQDP